MFAFQEGVVEEFDAEVGLGAVIDASGQRFAFHCTEIADGSRRIGVGTQVVFRTGAGRGGRWEAYGIAQNQWICPVCNTPNEGPPRSYEICRCCGWEDDPVQFDDQSYEGAANAVSLDQARTAFATDAWRP